MDPEIRLLIFHSETNPLTVPIKSTMVRVDMTLFGDFLCLKCERKGKRSETFSVDHYWEDDSAG